jgi:hypothetical protein
MSTNVTRPDVYVVLTVSGKVWEPKAAGSYFGILSEVFNSGMSAGGNWDAPSTLILNGKIVVERGLWDLAYAYGTADRDARAAAYEKVKVAHTPDWLAAHEAAR